MRLVCSVLVFSSRIRVLLYSSITSSVQSLVATSKTNCTLVLHRAYKVWWLCLKQTACTLVLHRAYKVCWLCQKQPSDWSVRALLSRARSLRNLLVSGNECGRVFPAGVGPGSPSRDAANWLPSRFSLSVETRRRYGWLRMMVFPGARLFPSPNLVPFGRVAARERQGALSRRAW